MASGKWPYGLKTTPCEACSGSGIDRQKVAARASGPSRPGASSDVSCYACGGRGGKVVETELCGHKLLVKDCSLCRRKV